MKQNGARKLILSHLVAGKMKVGEEIGIRIDQTLTQDATGTLVMLELEAMGLDRVKTELSAQYVDHNLRRSSRRSCAERRAKEAIVLAQRKDPGHPSPGVVQGAQQPSLAHHVMGRCRIRRSRRPAQDHPLVTVAYVNRVQVVGGHQLH